ncbi:MAG: hypothetical protein NVS3B20_09750 [Polyangiales bacterium]
MTNSDDRVVAICREDCTMQLPRGRYRLDVGETDDTRDGDKDVDVDGPTSLEVSAGSKSQRTWGLVMGITGIPITFISLVGYAAQYQDYNGNVAVGLLVTAAAGAGLTTAGWILFGTSRTRVRAESMTTRSAWPVAFGAAPVRGGFVFGGTIAF